MDNSALEICERVKSILASRNLTLSQVSKLTEKQYGRPSPYFVPHNLYHEFERRAFSPRLHQIFALSRLTGYRFCDWLRILGFQPETIAREQILLPNKKTILIDSTLEDPEQWIPWFFSKTSSLIPQNIIPLTEMINWGDATRLRSITRTDSAGVYAKVGEEDVMAFPNLVPGSIVRANPHLTESLLDFRSHERDVLFLVEHAAGVRCCRIQLQANNKIALLSDQLPYAQPILTLDREATIHGVIDLEIRSLVNQREPRVPANMTRVKYPGIRNVRHDSVGSLVRNARLKAGLSFPEASALSRQVAQHLRDDQYFVAPASLSDYEVMKNPPRHIAKVLTLCAIYGLHFSRFLQSMDLAINETARVPIPDTLLPRYPPAKSRNSRSESGDSGTSFLEELIRRFKPAPIFLHNSISKLSGLAHPDLRDFFWCGTQRDSTHPLIVNGILMIVNRHIKKPVHSRLWPLWKQPLYVLLKSDGTYMAGCCSTEDGMLVIHPYSKKYEQSQRLQNHFEAEVIGQVVAIARALA